MTDADHERVRAEPKMIFRHPLTGKDVHVSTRTGGIVAITDPSAEFDVGEWLAGHFPSVEYERFDPTPEDGFFHRWKCTGDGKHVIFVCWQPVRRAFHGMTERHMQRAIGDGLHLFGLSPDCESIPPKTVHGHGFMVGYDRMHP